MLCVCNCVVKVCDYGLSVCAVSTALGKGCMMCLKSVFAMSLLGGYAVEGWSTQYTVYGGRSVQQYLCKTLTHVQAGVMEGQSPGRTGSEAKPVLVALPVPL